MYVGSRELLTQHDSPAGVTAYLRSARATAWRSLCLSLPTSPSAFRRSDRARFCVRVRVVMSKYGSAVDGWDFVFERNDLWQPEAFETLGWLLQSCRLLTCCGALLLPFFSNVAGRLPSACSTLSLSLPLPTPPADRRLLALLKRSRTLFCSFWRWASARALSLARSAASSVWCCCSFVHSARDTAVVRKGLVLGLRARST